ncbi:hypothetical protein HDV00_008415 [Rhizophlyctis rosea]|nr:hypothetical protein HDV00_008415 [Rhizophlyctis rosea]
MEKLNNLHHLRVKTASLDKTKQSLLHAHERLEREDALLEELGVERRTLEREWVALVDMLKGIQKDLEAIGTAESALKQSRRSTSEFLADVQNNEYDPLKEEVDELRAQHGLPKLPNVRDEIEQEMARYLSERRERWKDSGLLDKDDAGPSTASPSGAPSSSNSTPKRRSSPSVGGSSSRGSVKRKRRTVT